jgi:hypothetical protein
MAECVTAVAMVRDGATRIKLGIWGGGWGGGEFVTYNLKEVRGAMSEIKKLLDHVVNQDDP